MLDIKEPPMDLLLIIRTLCKLRYDGGYSKKVSLPNGCSRRFGDLMSHKENVLMDPQLYTMFYRYIGIIKNKLGGALEINESEFLNFGSCLSLEFSAIDHSCRPNAVYMFIGRTLVVKALCDIANFDDVRVTYTDITQPRRMRRNFLKDQYFFDCTCEECTEDPLNLEKLKSHSPCCPECQNLVDGNKCMSCNKEVDLPALYHKILKITERGSTYCEVICIPE
ncbi:SMYD [Lepeophtheirus salmonis]|uniref:SMYD n=1 Tax=Lepeophtheirus salmonis TaxID=72036 RepID=A0A817FD95_LEPSM|nr:SMYD [Lepeophtheirus salmonis]